MRPRPGGPRLSPRRDKSRLRFHCAEGFATQRLARMLHSLVRVSRRVGCSHSDANDLGTSCRASKTGRTSAVSGHCTQCSRAGDLPTRGRSRPESARAAACEGPQRSPRSPPNCRAPGCTVSTQAQSHLPRRPPSRRQPPLAGTSRKCRADARAPDETSGASWLPRSAETPRRHPEPNEAPLQLHSFPS